MWNTFLNSNEETVWYRPFIDIDISVNADQLRFYMDASANHKLGFGCIFNEEWTFGQWEDGFIRKYDNEINIEFLELFALCMGIFTWISKLQGKRVIVFCDNMLVVNMVNNTTSGCRFCMVLIRYLTIKCMTNNLRVFARHVKGSSNVLSDSLSRMKLNKFISHAKDIGWIINDQPTPLLTELWPLSAYWNEKVVALDLINK